MINLVSCNYCSGSGKLINENLSSFPCFICGGVGQIKILEKSRKCNYCLGNGSKLLENGIKAPCELCKGTGYLQKFDNQYFTEGDAAKCNIIFIDIVKYSKRRIVSQQKIITKLNDLIHEVFTETSFMFNFVDIIKIPIGDGIALVFPENNKNFEYLKYSKLLLRKVYNYEKKEPCDQIRNKYYCNDHDHFKVRIGIGSGDCIIYKDINDNLNVAGNEMNYASRVMSKANPNQICLTESAYKQLIDFSQEPIYNHFKEYTNIKIKHDEMIKIFRYLHEVYDINNDDITTNFL